MLPPLARRDLLRLAGTGLLAGVAAACGTGRGSDGAVPADPAQRRQLHTGARLTSRPRPPTSGTPPTGLIPLQLSGSDRDGVVYVPPSYRHESPAPLVLTLHGATGSGRRGLRRLQPLADAAGLILLAPDSRGTTWDVAMTGGFGPDPEFVDRALDLVFACYAVDPSRLVAEGFSDGASYALSLGLLNGDLFTHVIAFSPGFMAEGSRPGEAAALRVARRPRSGAADRSVQPAHRPGSPGRRLRHPIHRVRRGAHRSPRDRSRGARLAGRPRVARTWF
jgi:poly(3-hydroxybutyrate) depolymerase